MAIVTGVLADFSRQAFVPLHPEINFVPSGPAVKSAGSVIYASRTIKVVPTSSAWTVDLEPNSGLAPETWYEVVIRWLDSEGNFILEDLVPGRLYVNASGGAFTDQFRTDASPLQVWVADGTTAPPEAKPQDLYLNTDTGMLYQVA